MNKPEVDWQICQACDPCEARLVCKVRAIMQIDPGEPVVIIASLCNNCQKCLTACAFGAIRVIHLQGSSRS